MNAKTTITATTYVALGLAATATFVLPDALSIPSAAAASGDTARVVGVVRDFKAAHPDFGTSPTAGYGHYAGNVSQTLSVNWRPMFAPGSDKVTDFVLNQQLVVPGSEFAVQATVLGAAIYSGAYHRPVTVQIDIGGEVFEPFGPYAQPVEGSVNDDQTATGWANPGSNPRVQTIMKTFAAGTPVAVAGKSWNLNSGDGSQNSHWGTKKAASTADNSVQIEVLVDGDPVPDYVANGGQASAEEFVKDYIDFDTNTMNLGTHQVILLYELAANGATGGDFQDLVVLLSIADDPSFFQNGKIGGSETATTGGFRVDGQWTDSAGNNIAPHLYANDDSGSGTVNLVNAMTADGSATVDSYDSSQGPYGDGNKGGAAPEFVTGMAMDPITPPAGLPWQKNLWYGGNGTSTLSADVHCDQFWLWNQHTVRIDGTVRVVVDSLFTLENFTSIDLLPGARLEVYALGTTVIKNNSDVNSNTLDPSRVAIYHLGPGDMTISNQSDVHAWVYAPSAPLVMTDTADLYGRFEGQTMDLSNLSNYHHDRNGGTPLDPCGNALEDVAGLAGPADDGAISSAATFNQWFRDAPGVNLSTMHALHLQRDGDGNWVYVTDAFFPLDGRLHGNEGDDHNTNFTFSFDAEFTYVACGSQFLECAGGDGVWVYIDRKLAIDLGGMGAPDAQRVDLDRLGLTDGETYRLHFFYAQRDDSNGVFELRTNLDFGQGGAPVTVSGVFD